MWLTGNELEALHINLFKFNTELLHEERYVEAFEKSCDSSFHVCVDNGAETQCEIPTLIVELESKCSIASADLKVRWRLPKLN